MKLEKLDTSSRSDTAAPAVELLNLLHRAPWLLFHHDGKVMPCVVAKTEADIRRFIETHDGHANLYYLLNADRAHPNCTGHQ
jgi:hypothetical protein